MLHIAHAEFIESLSVIKLKRETVKMAKSVGKFTTRGSYMGAILDASKYPVQKCVIKRDGLELIVPASLINRDGTIKKRIAKLIPEDGFTKQDAEILESKGVGLMVGNL